MEQFLLDKSFQLIVQRNLVLTLKLLSHNSVIGLLRQTWSSFRAVFLPGVVIKQLLDEVEHDVINYQNRGLPKPKAEADNTDTRF